MHNCSPSKKVRYIFQRSPKVQSPNVLVSSSVLYFVTFFPDKSSWKFEQSVRGLLFLCSPVWGCPFASVLSRGAAWNFGLPGLWPTVRLQGGWKVAVMCFLVIYHCPKKDWVLFSEIDSPWARFCSTNWPALKKDKVSWSIPRWRTVPMDKGVQIFDKAVTLVAVPFPFPFEKSLRSLLPHLLSQLLASSSSNFPNFAGSSLDPVFGVQIHRPFQGRHPFLELPGVSKGEMRGLAWWSHLRKTFWWNPLVFFFSNLTYL